MKGHNFKDQCYFNLDKWKFDATYLPKDMKYGALVKKNNFNYRIHIQNWILISKSLSMRRLKPSGNLEQLPVSLHSESP